MEKNEIVEIVKEFIKQEPTLIKYMLDNIDNLDPDSCKNIQEYLDKKKICLTFEEYFRRQFKMGVRTNEFSIKISMIDPLRFYIHPFNESGDTVNGQIKGNRIIFDSLAIYDRDLTTNYFK